MRCPNTPFATRLSGSAKETQLRIRSIFQWKKRRPPVWLFALLSITILGCGLIFGVRSKDSIEDYAAVDGFADSVIAAGLGQPWLRKTFKGDELALMLHYGEKEERRIAKTVLDQAEQAFSALGLTREEAEKTYGLLSRYVLYGLEDVQEQHSLKLIAAQVEGDEGHMWIHYSQRAVDTQGNTKRGSSDIFSLWTIRKDTDENWYVSNIKEPA